MTFARLSGWRIGCMHISLAFLVFVFTSMFASGQTETVLYDFQGGADGNFPSNQMISDKAGNLYGTNIGDTVSPFGNVFQLTPPASAGGSWTFTVLYTFTGGSDGNTPFGRLAMDAAGNLYGTTQFGGSANIGTVFRLAPPANKGGAWTESVLHSFTGYSDGWQPIGGVILDGAGNLYGTTATGGTTGCQTAGCGTVFRLSPTSGGTWHNTVLYEFQGGADVAFPLSELVIDSHHNLFGIAAQGGAGGMGAIFELSPPKTRGPWMEKLLYSFVAPVTPKFVSSANGLVRDRAGSLYGSLYQGASGFGSVYQLSPPTTAGGTWTFKDLYDFQSGSDGANPTGTLVLNQSGQLFGVTVLGGSNGSGTVFQLVPPSQTGGAWTETVLHSFGSGTDGANPAAGLNFGQGGLLFGSTSAGGIVNARLCLGFLSAGCGTVFNVQP